MRDIRDPDYSRILLRRARRIGPNALAWAERCFTSRDFPEQAFATVQGMTRLAETHDSIRVAVRRERAWKRLAVGASASRSRWLSPSSWTISERWMRRSTRVPLAW